MSPLEGGEMTWADVQRTESEEPDDREAVTVMIEYTVTREYDTERLPGESDDELYFRVHRIGICARESDDHWEGVEIKPRG